MNCRKTFNRIDLNEWTTIAVIFVMCSIAPNKAEAQTLFKPAVIYGAGALPASVAIGYLNGDANPDLAVANGGGDNVSIMLGNGDGTFHSAVNYGAGGRPNSVAIGDLNGDGDLDMAVANGPSGNVSVLFGNGDGTFHSAVNYYAGGEPWCVAIGDLNGDGDLDLAVANELTDNVSVLINTGDGPKFIDVPPGYWAEDAIYKIYEAGITTGCSKNPLKYCPQDNVTRAQMAVFLGRGNHGSSFTPPPATGIFDDVPVSYWAAAWIEQFYKDGITTGCSKNPLKYCPGADVTRAQMAILLLRSKHGKSYTPPKAAGIFSDVPVTYWAADWIEQLYNEVIITGCQKNPLL